jgi:hypothetical protein
MYGTVIKSHSPNEWEVKFDNGTMNILKSNQIRLTKGGLNSDPKPNPELQLQTSEFSNLLSPLSQNTIEKEIVLDGDDDNSDDYKDFDNLPVLASKNTSKKAKKVVSSDATAKTRYIDDESSDDESYHVDDDDVDDSDDDDYDDDDDDVIDDEVGDDDVISIEDDSDDDGDCTPIPYSQLSEHDKKLWDAKRKVQGLEGKVTECTTGTGRNKKKLVWTVICDHQPVDPVQPRSSAYLGIRKQEVIDKLEESQLPLTDLFLYFMFKDGEWKRWLRTMYQRISTLNINSTRPIKLFSPKEFLIGHALLIGASDCSERGKMLWQSQSDHSDHTKAWQSIAEHTIFTPYMRLYRFKLFRKVVAGMWEESKSNSVTSDPWYKF